jgi:hypothetical protein
MNALSVIVTVFHAQALRTIALNAVMINSDIKDRVLANVLIKFQFNRALNVYLVCSSVNLAALLLMYVIPVLKILTNT